MPDKCTDDDIAKLIDKGDKFKIENLILKTVNINIIDYLSV